MKALESERTRRIHPGCETLQGTESPFLGLALSLAPLKVKFALANCRDIRHFPALRDGGVHAARP
jgi:hypothetical protein